MERDRIHKILTNEYEDAKRKMNIVSQRFNEAVRDIPSGVPNPEGTLVISDVGRELAAARTSVATAIDRLNAFAAKGIVPEDLKGLNLAAGGRKRGHTVDMNSDRCSETQKQPEVLDSSNTGQ